MSWKLFLQAYRIKLRSFLTTYKLTLYYAITKSWTNSRNRCEIFEILIFIMSSVMIRNSESFKKEVFLLSKVGVVYPPSSFRKGCKKFSDPKKFGWSRWVMLHPNLAFIHFGYCRRWYCVPRSESDWLVCSILIIDLWGIFW